ncbi:hypothetical protein PIECOFPK_01179 [Mycovorax composti]|jgi:hypothetical protein|uniref:Uncharacterized protein n=2 Tax=Chitinophagaceae TaxID=563835 RepID=A0ABZ2EJ10_9BACT
MEYGNKNDFLIDAQVNGKSQRVQVTYTETTDGIPFYICHIDGQEITQIRKDENRWKQIWGDIAEADVKTIGEAIEAKSET